VSVCSFCPPMFISATAYSIRSIRVLSLPKFNCYDWQSTHHRGQKQQRQNPSPFHDIPGHTVAVIMTDGNVQREITHIFRVNFKLVLDTLIPKDFIGCGTSTTTQWNLGKHDSWEHIFPLLSLLSVQIFTESKKVSSIRMPVLIQGTLDVRKPT